MDGNNEHSVCVEELQRQLARKEGELEVIQSLSRQINTTLDLERIFNVSMESLDRAFGFRHSMILLTDAQNKDLELVASRGYEDATPGAKLPIGLGVIGVAARRKKLLRSVGVSYQLMYARQAGATVGNSGSEG